MSVFIYHSTIDSYNYPFVYHRLNDSIVQTRKESLNNHTHTHTHTHTLTHTHTHTFLLFNSATYSLISPHGSILRTSIRLHNTLKPPSDI